MKQIMKKLYYKIKTTKVDGIGIIEIILILVIIIGLVLIFRQQIVSIIEAAFNSINNNSTGINEQINLQLDDQ